MVSGDVALNESDREAPQSLIEAIQAQMRPCWRGTAGLPGARPVVTLDVSDVSLNRNGPVRNARVADQTPLNANARSQSMAKGAQDAVLKCCPFQLPGDKYALWRELKMAFRQD